MPRSNSRHRQPDQHSHDIDLDPKLSQLLAAEFPDLVERYEQTRALYGVINKLANLRRVQGVTQTQLAERLGRPQSLISAIESGRVSPHIETLVAIARELGHSLTFDLQPLAPGAETPRTSNNGRGSRRAGR